MEYFAPTALDDALSVLDQEPVTVLAGGTDVYPAQGNAPCGRGFLDITRIAALRGIEAQGPGWRIGAATRWSELVQAGLPPGFDGLRAAAREVGSVQIQNAGTIAGNLCNASPAADGVPALLTLGAEVELASLRGTRRLALEDFITGPRQTALETGEMMTAIHIPALPDDARAGFHKLGSRRYLVISIAMVALVLVPDETGRIAEARVAVGACSPVAQRLPALEAALVGRDPARVRVRAEHLEALSPIDDVRGSAAYRREVVAVQIARLIERVGGTYG